MDGLDVQQPPASFQTAAAVAAYLSGQARIVYFSNSIETYYSTLALQGAGYPGSNAGLENEQAWRIARVVEQMVSASSSSFQPQSNLADSGHVGHGRDPRSSLASASTQVSSSVAQGLAPALLHQAYDGGLPGSLDQPAAPSGSTLQSNASPRSSYAQAMFQHLNSQLSTTSLQETPSYPPSSFPANFPNSYLPVGQSVSMTPEPAVSSFSRNVYPSFSPGGALEMSPIPGASIAPPNNSGSTSSFFNGGEVEGSTVDGQYQWWVPSLPSLPFPHISYWQGRQLNAICQCSNSASTRRRRTTLPCRT